MVRDISITVDGIPLKSLESYRFESPAFNFVLPDDNILGVDCKFVNCQNPQSVSDGYWIMLPPLSSGNHTVHFTGSFRDTESNDLFFGLDVTYELTVGEGTK